jgi:hypothetical protein
MLAVLSAAAEATNGIETIGSNCTSSPEIAVAVAAAAVGCAHRSMALGHGSDAADRGSTVGSADTADDNISVGAGNDGMGGRSDVASVAVHIAVTSSQKVLRVAAQLMWTGCELSLSGLLPVLAAVVAVTADEQSNNSCRHSAALKAT